MVLPITELQRTTWHIIVSVLDTTCLEHAFQLNLRHVFACNAFRCHCFQCSCIRHIKNRHGCKEVKRSSCSTNPIRARLFGSPMSHSYVSFVLWMLLSKSITTTITICFCSCFGHGPNSVGFYLIVIVAMREVGSVYHVGCIFSMAMSLMHYAWHQL